MSTYFSYTRARGIEHSSSSEALEFAQIIRLKIVDIYISFAGRKGYKGI